MTRARWIGLGVLVLLLGLLPFIPRGGGDDGTARRAAAATRPAAHTPLTAGYGRVTPAYRQAIDRVVDAGLAAGRTARTASPRALVADVVRCATFEGQRYCLGQGWTHLTQAQVRRRTADRATRQASRPATRGSGDLSTLD